MTKIIKEICLIFIVFYFIASELYNKMTKIIKEICFIFNVFFIIASELIMYNIFKDYSKFIDQITRRLASSNMLYVKIFQAFSLNNNLIDCTINDRLLQFTDNVPWSYNDFDLSDIIEIIDKYNLYLKFGYEIPINSGMISLVFKVYEKETNKPMIIKIKRKNIDITINDGIEKLKTFMYILSFIPLIHKYQLSEIVNKNIEIIKNQTNFLEEVENMNKMKDNCKNLKYIKIPLANKAVTKVYPNIILMECIDGIKIKQIKQEDYEGFAKQILKFGFVTTIIHGLVHGDLHGGNILFIKDNNDNKYPYKIGVIDFGIIYKIEPKYKDLLFDILTQFFYTHSRETAIKLLNSGIIDPPGILEKISKAHYESIIKITSEIIEETINNSKKANQAQIYKFISNLKDYLNNSEIADIGIRPSNNFIKSQLVLAMAHGTTLTLCNDDFISLADKVINELFHTNMMIE